MHPWSCSSEQTAYIAFCVIQQHSSVRVTQASNLHYLYLLNAQCHNPTDDWAVTDACTASVIQAKSRDVGAAVNVVNVSRFQSFDFQS